MRTVQLRLSDAPAHPPSSALAAHPPQLAFVFGPVAALRDARVVKEAQAVMPSARLVGCSALGQISEAGVTEEETVVTGVHFDHPAFDVATVHLDTMRGSLEAGARLGEALNAPGLHHIVVLGPGIDINGSALVEGIRGGVPATVVVCGGLAGDGARFEETVTLCDTRASDRQVVGIGFYDERLRFTHGCSGGWEPFGPARTPTRFEDNRLFELDGEPAVDVYKRYLGSYAAELPGSGLLFPFCIVGDPALSGVIRSIVGIDEATGGLVLAGDIPPNAQLQLMHAQTDKLVDGAALAAERLDGETDGDALTLLVSCVGRKLIMGGRVEEEVEAVTDALGDGGTIAGFYSHGEFSPHLGTADCRLHNQTMTVARMTER